MCPERRLLSVIWNEQRLVLSENVEGFLLCVSDDSGEAYRRVCFVSSQLPSDTQFGMTMVRKRGVFGMVAGSRTLSVLAVVVAAVGLLVWVRVGMDRETHAPAAKAIPDLSVTSPLNLPGGGLAPAEAYEVYSALYQSSDEPLVFSEDSVTDIPQVNGSCLRPSSQDEREMTDAFQAANQQSRRWEKRFVIPGGYRLIPRSEAAVVQTCLETHGRDAARCGRYKDIRHVRFLGVPGFDRAHARALVSVVKMCGGFCGSGGIFEVEKVGGVWRRAEATDFTRECSWMY